jgi:hypothetical protein
MDLDRVSRYIEPVELRARRGIEVPRADVLDDVSGGQALGIHHNPGLGALIRDAVRVIHGDAPDSHPLFQKFIPVLERIPVVFEEMAYRVGDLDGNIAVEGEAPLYAEVRPVGMSQDGKPTLVRDGVDDSLMVGNRVHRPLEVQANDMLTSTHRHLARGQSQEVSRREPTEVSEHLVVGHRQEVIPPLLIVCNHPLRRPVTVREGRVRVSISPKPVGKILIRISDFHSPSCGSENRWSQKRSRKHAWPKSRPSNPIGSAQPPLESTLFT